MSFGSSSRASGTCRLSASLKCWAFGRDPPANTSTRNLQTKDSSSQAESSSWEAAWGSSWELAWAPWKCREAGLLPTRWQLCQDFIYLPCLRSGLAVWLQEPFNKESLSCSAFCCMSLSVEQRLRSQRFWLSLAHPSICFLLWCLCGSSRTSAGTRFLCRLHTRQPLSGLQWRFF